MTIEKLIDDYKKKLNYCNEFLNAQLSDKGKGVRRMRERANCYRAFILELEKLK